MRWGKRNSGKRELRAFRRAVARNRTDSKLNLLLGWWWWRWGGEWGWCFTGSISGAGSGQRENKQWSPFKDPAKNNQFAIFV